MVLGSPWSGNKDRWWSAISGSSIDGLYFQRFQFMVCNSRKLKFMVCNSRNSSSLSKGFLSMVSNYSRDICSNWIRSREDLISSSSVLPISMQFLAPTFSGRSAWQIIKIPPNLHFNAFEICLPATDSFLMAWTCS